MQRPVEQLRAATRDVHESLETLPYARSVLDGSVPLDAYKSFLRAVYLVHVALEQLVESSGRADLRLLFGVPGQRRSLLERDLADLAVDPNAVDPAALRALLLTLRMRLAARREPEQLLGYMYVIEGSQLGGLVQQAALSRRPELQQGGLAYLRGAGKNAHAGFQLFLERLEHALAGRDAVESAIRGAVAAFEEFRALLTALAPSEQERLWLVSELNHSAGCHAIPEDLRELRAALLAAEESFQGSRYYAARYGERGLRFSRSDSAWLATLAREEVSLASRHVHWLARVLAARGMPRWLLERHLQTLHAKLTNSVPEWAAAYQTLLTCAAELRHARIAAIPEARIEALTSTFVRGRSAEEGIAPDEAAALLVAAAADERCNIAGAVASLEGWLADPRRFSAEWVAAARRTLAAARSGS
jgi:heme oxygenase